MSRKRLKSSYYSSLKLKTIICIIDIRSVLIDLLYNLDMTVGNRLRRSLARSSREARSSVGGVIAASNPYRIDLGQVGAIMLSPMTPP